MAIFVSFFPFSKQLYTNPDYFFLQWNANRQQQEREKHEMRKRRKKKKKKQAASAHDPKRVKEVKRKRYDPVTGEEIVELPSHPRPADPAVAEAAPATAWQAVPHPSGKEELAGGGW